jgi:hypothetical protein
LEDWTKSEELDNLADIISWDVLAQILNEAIETVRKGYLQLRETSMYASKINEYMDNLEHVRKIVRRYEEHAKKGIELGEQEEEFVSQGDESVKDNPVEYRLIWIIDVGLGNFRRYIFLTRKKKPTDEEKNYLLELFKYMEAQIKHVQP